MKPEPGVDSSSEDEDDDSEEEVSKEAPMSPRVLKEIRRVQEQRHTADDQQELKAFRDVQAELLARRDREKDRKRSGSPLLPLQVCFLGILVF